MVLFLLENHQDVVLRGGWEWADDRTRPRDQLKQTQWTDQDKNSVGDSYSRGAARARVDVRVDMERHRKRALV